MSEHETRNRTDAPAGRTDASTDRDGERTRPTMREISHTNPATGETTGRLFARGPVVATDGGRPAATGPRSDRVRTTEDRERAPSRADGTMRSVSHTPPYGADGANRAFERGGERPD